MSRVRSLLFLLFLLALLAWMRSPDELLTTEGARVHVIDGDSLRIGGRVIRLADVDAVELHQSCRDTNGMAWDCGHEARDALEAMVAGGGLSCQSRTTDRYGRAVAQCTTHAVKDLSAAMVAKGWAVSGDIRRAGIHATEEQKARTAKLGIWRGTFEQPSEWRAAHPRKP
jgi:endonuclease YncB( thermonuclease family)